MMDSDGGSISISSLLCQEDGACLNSDGHEEEEGVDSFDGTAEDDEYMELLVTREARFEIEDGRDRLDLESSYWLMSARSDVVKWIMETRKRFGFSFQIVFLSVNYLDRFLIKRRVKSGQDWAIRLLSVACLSLAAKLEGIRAPKLPEFQVEGYYFGSSSISRMELLVLTTLEWRMRSVTPLPYLFSLVSKYGCKLQAEDLLFNATQLILATMQKVTSTDHRPSVLAAAAFFMASGRALSKKSLEYDLEVISFCGSSKIDHVLSCCNVILRTKEKLKTDKNLSSSEEGNINSCSDDSIISNKKRRLAVRGYMRHCLISNKKKSD